MRTAKIRFWYYGIAPRKEFVRGSTHTYETLTSGGWRPGRYHLGGLVAWMEENNWSIKTITRVDQRNGRAGYRALYELELQDNWQEPEEPLWVKEDLPNPAAYLQRAISEADHISVPYGDGDLGMEIKPHLPPMGGQPWITV